MKKKVIIACVNILCKLHILKPIQVARLKHFYKFHKMPDYEHPRDINEKINWIKFYGDTSRWAELADKYKVRGYVQSLGFGDTLVKLYGKWDCARDIDWSVLRYIASEIKLRSSAASAEESCCICIKFKF